MSVHTVKKEDFTRFVAALIDSEQNVVGIQAKADHFAFDDLTDSQALRLDYDVSILPPKKYVLPPKETLLNFEVGGPCQSVFNAQPTVLVGVHPYDMIAINQMDELFSQNEYDTHYMNRRQQLSIIVCDVARASENIFASSMNTAVVDSGYDIYITDIGNQYVVEVATNKGQDLMKLMPNNANATPEDLEKRKVIRDKNKAHLNKHNLECNPSFLPKLLEKGYDHPIWAEKAKQCFSCGSCNQVCPTCYCFDVQDEVNWDTKTGDRYRVWDGCLLENFASVAGDHNFRDKREARFRHRLYRKGKYVPQKIGGQIACVGCGRCITACVANIANPVEVYNKLMEETELG